MSLKKRQLATLKEKIQAEIVRLNANFKEVKEDELLSNSECGKDEVDQASSEYERSQLLRFRNRDAFYVKKLNKAMARFECDEYGVCTDCDGGIKFERLMARPTAELCIGCKDEAEKEEQGNYLARQSKSSEKRDVSVGVR
jgi:DnaK suppressor protein